MTTEVSKSGETWLSFALETYKQGVLLEAKAHPAVEDLFQSASKGETAFVEAYGGRLWIPAPGEQEPVKIYVPAAGWPTPPKGTTITSPGHLLNIEDEFINMSFLAVKGIGSPFGIKFLITSPMSPVLMRETKPKIASAMREFVRENLIHTRVSFVLSSQEV